MRKLTKQFDDMRFQPVFGESLRHVLNEWSWELSLLQLYRPQLFVVRFHRIILRSGHSSDEVPKTFLWASRST